MKPVAHRIYSTVDAGAEPLPPEATDLHPLSISWDGSLIASETGDYNLGLKANGIFRVRLEGVDITSSYGGDPNEAKLGRVHLEAGKPAGLHVEYTPPEHGTPNARLVWSKSISGCGPRR